MRKHSVNITADIWFDEDDRFWHVQAMVTTEEIPDAVKITHGLRNIATHTYAAACIQLAAFLETLR